MCVLDWLPKNCVTGKKKISIPACHSYQIGDNPHQVFHLDVFMRTNGDKGNCLCKYTLAYHCSCFSCYTVVVVNICCFSLLDGCPFKCTDFFTYLLTNLATWVIKVGLDTSLCLHSTWSQCIPDHPLLQSLYFKAQNHKKLHHQGAYYPLVPIMCSHGA